MKLHGTKKDNAIQTDSNMATPLAPMFPLGVTPRPPIRPAHRSLKHSHMTSALPITASDWQHRFQSE